MSISANIFFVIVSQPFISQVYWSCILEEMGISFTKPPHCILYENSSYPGGQWLPGCSLNPAEICLRVNAKRNLDDIAVAWRDEGEDNGPVQKMTLQELRREVWYVALFYVLLNLLFSQT